MGDELKLIKITQPEWLGYLAPQIKIFTEKLGITTITYETLFTYFLKTIQHGGDIAEFWVVFKEDKPIAFAHWFISSLPHRGLVSCDYINSWNRMREPVEMLMERFIEFGKEKNAPLYSGTATNETLFRVFRKAFKKFGIELDRMEWVEFIGRKV
jgi:hypothetical protein